MALAAASMAANASTGELTEAELSGVSGRVNYISGLNVGLFSDSVYSVASGLGADSWASSVQFAGGYSMFSLVNALAGSGVSGLNIAGLSGVSLANMLGIVSASVIGIGPAFTGISLANGGLGLVSVIPSGKLAQGAAHTPISTGGSTK